MKQTKNPTTQATRRYLLEMTILMAAYLIILFGTRIFVPDSIQGPLRILVEVAPALPLFFVFLAALRMIRNTDELARQVIIESLAIAGAVTAVLSVIYGFLERDVLPCPSAWWFLAVFVGIWAASSFILRRRYE